MSQIIDQDAIRSDEFYKQEVHRMLNEMKHQNEKMARDQEEIDWLKKQSAETMIRIQENLERIEKVLA